MISLVIPVYNEQENLLLLAASIEKAAQTWNEPFEVIFVDDGSTDHSLEILRSLSQRNESYRYLSLSRNFGHQTAVSAGLKYSSGDVIAVIDADLQDPPEVLGAFIDKVREGYDVAYAIRQQRKEGFLARACYWAFYRILARFSSIRIPLDSGDFCVMSRRVLDHINALPERNRFVRGLRSWVGFNQIGLAYERQARCAGDAKYTFAKLLRLALDGLFSFTYRPLQLIGVFGLLISGLAVGGLIFFFLASAFDISILGHSPREVPGFTSLTLAVLLLGGVQLISLWIIGEYIGRIFDEVKQRPLFLVKETCFDPESRDNVSGVVRQNQRRVHSG